MFIRLVCLSVSCLVAFLLLPFEAASAVDRGVSVVQTQAGQTGAIDTFALHDARRNKDIALRITFPVEAGRYPVIIFSHGAAGSKETDWDLTKYWASYGYVCIQPTHNDSLEMMRKNGTGSTISDALKQAENAKSWVERVSDIEAVIDDLASIEEQFPKELGGKMNKEALGVAGHSFGAFTTLLLSGATPYVPPNMVPDISGVHSFFDKRIDAAIALSPQGIVKEGIGFRDAEAFKDLRLPLMVITGSADTGMHGQPSSWRTEPFKYAPPGDKYLVYIKGADHMTFAGDIRHMPQHEQPLPGLLTGLGLGYLRDSLRASAKDLVFVRIETKSQTARLFPFVEEASVTFWDAYLKGNAAAKQALINNAIAKESVGVASIEDK